MKTLKRIQIALCFALFSLGLHSAALSKNLSERIEVLQQIRQEYEQETHKRLHATGLARLTAAPVVSIRKYSEQLDLILAEYARLNRSTHSRQALEEFRLELYKELQNATVTTPHNKKGETLLERYYAYRLELEKMFSKDELTRLLGSKYDPKLIPGFAGEPPDQPLERLYVLRVQILRQLTDAGIVTSQFFSPYGRARVHEYQAAFTRALHEIRFTANLEAYQSIIKDEIKHAAQLFLFADYPWYLIYEWGVFTEQETRSLLKIPDENKKALTCGQITSI